MENTNVVSVLRNLIQTLEDGKEGFRLAAEATDNRDMKILFAHYAGQRADFAEELHHRAEAYGDAAYDESSSLAGALHRGWLNLRAAVAAKDAAAILSECERGEDHAVAEYRKALDENLPPEIETVIGAQSLEIKTAHDKVRQLRDLAKAA